MTQVRLDHVSVTTADLDRSLAFYCGLLGLPLAGRGESDDEELSLLAGTPGVRILWADVSLGGGQLLELVQFLSPRGAAARLRNHDPGATHIGLAVEDLDGLHRRLTEAGVPVRSEPVELREQGAWTGARCMFVSDPDGVSVELVERPKTLVVPDLERTVAEEG